MKTCSLCEKPTRSRGWCKKHYTRWYRHGNPTTVLRVYRRYPKDTTCSVCGDKHYQSGWCKKHYTRWYTYGNVSTVRDHPPKRRLTSDQALDIRIAREQGATLKELARQYDVSLTVIHHIVHNVTYREAPMNENTD